MFIWDRTDWQQYLAGVPHRTGIRIRFEQGVDPIVKTSILNFVRWARQTYAFPLRLVVYVKNADRIRAKDGEMVCGTFFRPFEYGVEPYIRLAAGDYDRLEKMVGKDNAAAGILESLFHELTHYYQNINKAPLSIRGEEIQAARAARKMLDMYSRTRDHPWCG